MSVVDKAIETQLKNIQTKTGKTLDQLGGILRASGFTKHGELRDFAKRELGLGHGDANTLVHVAFKSDGASAAAAAGASDRRGARRDLLRPKAALRPIHDAFMAGIAEVRRVRGRAEEGVRQPAAQEAVRDDRPGSKTRVDVGINMKGVKGTDRLVELPPGGMCRYKVGVTNAKEIDKELIGWVKQAFDAAG